MSPILAFIACTIIFALTASMPIHPETSTTTSNNFISGITENQFPLFTVCNRENTTPPPGLTPSKLRSNSLYNPTQEATETLNWLHSLLSNFARGPSFDTKKFICWAPQVQKSLDHMAALMKTWPLPMALKDQYNYSKHMYLVMENATTLFRAYSETTTAHHLLRRVIQLNVNLLALCDARGIPDPSLEYYRKDVTRYVSLFAFLNEVYVSLPEQASHLRVLFDHQIYHAGNALALLKISLPRETAAQVL